MTLRETCDSVRPARPTLKVPLPYAPIVRSFRIGIFCHMFYPDLFGDMRRVLFNIPKPNDLYLSTCTEDNRATLGRMFKDWRGKVEVQQVPNRGRDIAPKFAVFGPAHSSSDLVLHLHTKKNPPGWRDHILNQIVGSRRIVESILYAFSELPMLGVVAGTHWPPVLPHIHWASNRDIVDRLIGRMQLRLLVRNLDFPSGSMFWARPLALTPLLDLRLRPEDFPEEAGQSDGTIAHAIERLIFIVCEHQLRDWLLVSASDRDNPFRPPSVAELRRVYGATTPSLRRLTWAV